mmetsp:Transcript_39222/g.45610  ORF Transcript_39222/g.45610 Transcript_39222/m.45610 type:complete len:87 (+) Transcript_39222:73-333(+)
MRYAHRQTAFLKYTSMNTFSFLLRGKKKENPLQEEGGQVIRSRRGRSFTSDRQTDRPTTPLSIVVVFFFQKGNSLLVGKWRYVRCE